MLAIADATKIVNANKNAQATVLATAKKVKLANAHKKLANAATNAIAIKNTYLDFSKKLNVIANN